MEHDVFISYSSKEKSVADGVCHYLEDNGVKCWMAPRDIPVGTDYGDLIDEAIKSCRVVVLVYSQHSFISKWVKGEINVAFDEGKPIAPFRIDETGIKGAFRVMLNQMHWIDAYPSYADRLPDLLSSICGFIGREVPNPQAPELHNPAVEEHPGPSQPTEAELHIEVDADCRVYRFNKEIMIARKEEDNVLMLQKGKHKLRFVSVENSDVSDDSIVEIKDTSYSDFIEISLAARITDLARQVREEAERKAKEEEERRTREKAECNRELSEIIGGLFIYAYKKEAERKAKEETDRKAHEEAERIAREEAVRKVCEEAKRKAREEVARKAREDAERKAKEKYTLVGKGETILGKKPEFEDLVNVSVDKGVLEIKGAFYNCKKIKKVKLNSGMKIIRKDSFNGCRSLEEINIPNGVHTIEKNAFHDCISLKKVNIPGSVITIGGGWASGAFCGCENLETLVLNEGLEEIQRDAFWQCKALGKVVIPSTVRTIEKDAFSECKNLKTVVLKSKKTNYSTHWITPSFPVNAQIIIEEK